MKRLSGSLKIFLGLLAFLVLVKLLFLVVPVRFPVAGQEGAFSWLTLTAIAAMGFTGLLLSRRTGFPEMWDAKVSKRQMFLVPCLVGLVYGLVTVVPLLLGEAYRLHPHALGAEAHVKLPLSIPFYAYGAIFLEILLRLFALPLLVWLISNVLLRGRWQTQVFWLAAVIVAFYEPLPYMLAGLESSSSELASLKVLFSTVTGSLFISNVVAAFLFRRYGFLAPVLMRLSHYLIWHILYGGLV